MPPKKRGRKPKPKPENPIEKPPPKKRGRKPKGGKIVDSKKIIKKNKIFEDPHIILHLKCNSSLLKEQDKFALTNAPKDLPQAYALQNSKLSNLTFNDIKKENTLKNKKVALMVNTQIEDNDKIDLKSIWNKLDKLKRNLKVNNVSDKKSACFWCTYKFDNPAVYIPKCYVNKTAEVYGCFCSPQCAVSYLKNQNIDNSTRWERYSLLNNIYGTIYNYNKNIKPAPDPFYTLDKYYGNLDINEYRQLLHNQTLLLVVEKPMTKITPELYEDNNEIPDVFSNLLEEHIVNTSKNKYRLKRKSTHFTKNNATNTIFNIS
jgi:hypothetical protein